MGDNCKKRRGRPIDPNAKRGTLHLRLSKEETEILSVISERTGRSKTDILLDSVRREIGKK